MSLVTFYNYNIDLQNNILEAFYKTVEKKEKYKVNIHLPYYYMIPEDAKINLNCNYIYIEYKDFNVITSNNHIVECSNEKNLSDIRSPIKENFRLIIAEDYCSSLKQYKYNSMFSNHQWFFILRDMNLNVTFDIEEDKIGNITKCNDIMFDKIFNKKVEYVSVDYNILAFDIECFIPDSGAFTTGYNTTISHISAVYRNTINNVDERYLFYNTNTQKCSLKELETDEFKKEHQKKNCKYFLGNEKEILKAFISLYHRLPKDIVTTYNGGSFDFDFITTRCMFYNIENLKVSLEKQKTKKKDVIENKNLLDYIYLDLFNYTMKTFDNMLDSYTLDNISNYLLNCMVNKYEVITPNSFIIYLDKPESYFLKTLETAGFIEIYDISYKILEIRNDNSILLESKEMFNVDVNRFKIHIGKDDVDLQYMYKNYSKKICLDLGLYNLHDSALLLGIIDSLSLTNTLKAASDISYIPHSLILKKYNGSQIKALALKISLENKLIILHEKNHIVNEKFIGANVMVPKEKFVENPIICLDINSLYPNNIIWGNMSPEKLLAVFKCHDIINLNIMYNKLCDIYKFPDYFVIKINEESESPPYQIALYDRKEIGLIPKMLNYLLKERKRVNKEIAYKLKNDKDFENSDEYRRLDALQLQFKIRGNSLYGLLSSEFFFIEGRIIGESCTALGRKLIKYVDKCINGMEVCEDGIVYYDSNIESPVNVKLKKYEDKLIEDIEDKVLIKLKSQYIDTDSNYVICEPHNKKAISYLQLSKLEKQQLEYDDKKCKLLLDKKFNEYLEILLKIGIIVCDYINNYILFDNIQTKFENILFQAIFRSSKQYSGKVVSLDNPTKIKDKYSGTIIKKRSYSPIHKNIIGKLNNNIELHLKYRIKISKSTLDNILDKIISIYKNIFESNNVDINDFIISRKLNSIYKNPENHNLEITKKYNSLVSKQEEIVVGSRYNYIYITDNIYEQYTKLPTGITKYEFIITDHKIVNGYLINNHIERLDKNKKYRIFYEVYFERIFADIVRIYYNTESFNYALQTYKQLFGKTFDTKSLKI
jgi:DNA polymerase elongation subunit (family B)